MKINKVILTDSFMKQYDDFRGKESVDLDYFLALVILDIQTGIRYLDRPLCKIKIKLKSKAIRVAAQIDHDILVLLPFFITDKNDKRYGHNMVLSNVLIRKRIMSTYQQSLDDIAHDRYIEKIIQQNE